MQISTTRNNITTEIYTINPQKTMIVNIKVTIWFTQQNFGDHKDDNKAVWSHNVFNLKVLHFRICII